MSQYKIPSVDDSAIVFEDYLRIRRDKLTMPNEVKYDHFVLITQDTSVVVCAQTKAGLWVLTEEYRHATKKYILGLPGGYLNKDEDPLIGGCRELMEETGYYSEDLHLLGSAYPYAGVTAQKTSFVLAKDAVQKSIPMPEPTELLHTVLKTTEEIVLLIKNGHPIDANLCTAFYLYGLK